MVKAAKRVRRGAGGVEVDFVDSGVLSLVGEGGKAAWRGAASWLRWRRCWRVVVVAGVGVSGALGWRLGRGAS